MFNKFINSIIKSHLCNSLVLSFLVLFLLLPNFAFAQGVLPPIVPCGSVGDPCNFCDFYVLAARVLTYMMYLATALAVLFIAWGGFLMLTSGASPGNLAKGQKAVWNAIIGLVIAFASWMIVNTFVIYLINTESDGVPFMETWFNPQCS